MCFQIIFFWKLLQANLTLIRSIFLMNFKIMLVQIRFLWKLVSALPALEWRIFCMRSQVVVEFAWTAYKFVTLIVVFAPVQPKLVYTCFRFLEFKYHKIFAFWNSLVIFYLFWIKIFAINKLYLPFFFDILELTHYFTYKVLLKKIFDF